MERLSAPVEEGEPETGEEGHEGDHRQRRPGDGAPRCGSEPGPVHQPDAEEAASRRPPVPEQREDRGVDEAQHQRQGDARGQHGVELVDAGHDAVDAGELGGGDSARGDERRRRADVEGEDAADRASRPR